MNRLAHICGVCKRARGTTDYSFSFGLYVHMHVCEKCRRRMEREREKKKERMPHALALKLWFDNFLNPEI